MKSRYSIKRSPLLRGFTVCLLFALVMTVAAQDQVAQLAGKWERTIYGSTVALVFDAENNYKVDFESDGNIEVYGSYVIDKDTITFNDKPGELAVAEPGIYTFKMGKDNVTFTIENDPSEGRSGMIAGTWTKAKK